MKRPSREEQRQLVRQMEETGRQLEIIRRRQLRDLPYRWEDVDALLTLGEQCGLPSRTTSGLVEMQRWFMKAGLDIRKRSIRPPGEE